MIIINGKIYNYNSDFELFNTLSQKSTKYNYLDCVKYWDECKTLNQKFDINYIHFIVRKNNPNGYYNLITPIQTVEELLLPVITISRRYLLSPNSLNEDDILSNNIRLFFNSSSDAKSLTLKKPLRYR